MVDLSAYKGNTEYDYELVMACPVCGGKGEFEVAARHKEGSLKLIIQLYSCPNCNSSYHNPRMTEASMVKYYESGKYRTFSGRANYHPDRPAHHQRMKFFDWIPGLSPRRCLDVGCGDGFLLKLIQERFGCEIVGHDVYVDPNAHVPVITDRDKIDGKYDLIICTHVLEHLTDPLGMLDWIVSKLSDDGLVFIEVPTYKQLTIPHPIQYSKKSLPLLVQRMKLNGLILDFSALHHPIANIIARHDPWDTDWLKDTGLFNQIPDQVIADLKPGNEDCQLNEYAWTIMPLV